MRKSNLFRSSNFWMDESDIIHILIKDESGTTVAFTLNTENSDGTNNTEDVPGAPTIQSATSITSTGFTVNWYFSENTTGYYLDIATDEDFLNMVAGYDGLDVGNVNTHPIVGLLNNFTYYCRIRGYNDVGTSIDSNTEDTKTAIGGADDWFLPSKDELNKAYVNLVSGTDENAVEFTSLSGITKGQYWSSTENSHSWAWTQYLTDEGAFYDGDQSFENKSNNSYLYGAMRIFVTSVIYGLRDEGPCGGYICYIVDNGDGTYTYYEFYGITSSFGAWSNITAVAVTGLSSAIGQGASNTTKIIAQPGHITSAASYCNDLDL